MAKLDPNVLAHLEWIGFVRPTGLVVSAPALVRAGAILDRSDAHGQHLLNSCIEQRVFDPDESDVPYLPDFRTFAETVLDWRFSPNGYAGTPESPIPPELEVVLSEYDETLRPDYAVREPDTDAGVSQWQLLVRVLDPGESMDQATRGSGGLDASAHGRMERLLRQTGAPAGLLFNGQALRLVSAPRGESSGWIDFSVSDMTVVAGRPISTALRLLLNERRLLALPRPQRLAALLKESRRFQNEVSERLAEQVLQALYELLRGFQAAHDASKGDLLRQPLAEHPDEVYRALLTVILRLVFLLYAEERDMLPEDEIYVQHYSLGGLYERLREDAALFPDTMDQRFGAWAQLLVLFRLLYDGAEAGGLRLPRRHGVLFDPDRFPFLEGRSGGGSRQVGGRIEPPLVPDGILYRALDKLLVLDGERISYRALDVEQIGSVYETMMGFRLETATGRSVAMKPQKKHGAPTVVDLEALLREPAAEREKWLQDRSDRKLTERVKTATAAASTLEDLHAALLPATDSAATPDLVPRGAMVFQPSEERRRSGSHYTPRVLTEPIVRTTLEPILARLREADDRPPRPVQILDLKVCDPAMGSGAFLVEACRQLGDALVEAWHAHDEVPAIPPDEDEAIFARRLVAQRCLYGVDRNRVAVDLAKVSLWLVTLAKDHSLTFVDHALRHGDSLVGLSRKQIEAFHWDSSVSWESPFRAQMRDQLRTVADLRQRIREAGETVSDGALRDMWDEAQSELGRVRLFGDLVLAAFFEGEKPKDRERKRDEYVSAVVSGDAERYRDWLEEWRHAEKPLAPFHWEIEFPEVFERENPGFDAIVGNPPFLGGSIISRALGDPYGPYLKDYFTPGQKGRVDLVAYFLLRSVELLRNRGLAGLLATSQAFEGDAKRVLGSSLSRLHGRIQVLQESRPWPGEAAVYYRAALLEHQGGSAPRSEVVELQCARLRANRGVVWRGTEVRGEGFILSAEERQRLLTADAINGEVISPYMNGKDLNTRPDVSPGRWIINFGTMAFEDASRYAEPFRIVTERVKPERDVITKQIHESDYWKYWDKRLDSYARLKNIGRCLALSAVTSSESVAWVDYGSVFQNKLLLFLFSTDAAFSLLQSRVHWLWVRETTSSRGPSGINYSPTHCFETFPFPGNWESNNALHAAGTNYYAFRAALMVKNNEGLTKTYNRFHDVEERDPEIAKLRELHALMDRAALDAYGLIDVATDCEFLLDHEIDEEEWGGKKKPCRYRWPNEVRDEVLTRLLQLNAARAADETRAGATSGAAGKRRSAKSSTEPADDERLFT